ncbi:hypothetical protein CEP54_016301, partial [Fusarium duplospermum]
MSISEKCNALVPAVLLCGTEFSVSQDQPTDDSRRSRGNSNLASVPNSAGSNNYTRILGSPAAPRNNGGPSSSASSSITTDVHARPYLDENILNEHYLAFRVVLDTSDPKDNQQLNKSNPKLLRLTLSQLYELSTDVFDELVRRQVPASPNDPPAFLLPNNAFSSTRNQGRQMLSAVGSLRFRDLVADVAHEIKRRFPYFARASSSKWEITHNKLIEECKSQLRQLSDKLRSMEDAMKNRGGEINGILGEECSRATAYNLEKQEWNDIRLDLENKLAEEQALNDSMRQELQQVREDHDAETEKLRNEVASAQTEAQEAQEAQRVAAQHAAAQQASRGGIEPVKLDSFLEQVNGRLRHSLLEQQQAQQQAMKEIRKEVKEFLREMRVLSHQSSSVYVRQAEELGQTTKRLQQEVYEWRIRYVCAKEQLRSTCASSVELGPEHKAIKLDRGKCLADDHGLVKDIHVTEFQTAIDKLLHKARTDDSGSVIDAVKSVVVSVRRITHDATVSRSDGEDSALQAKLRGEVSSATNSLIRASMNCAAGAGLYPLSLLDAAVSRLAGAIFGLLLVKVQTTPA